MAWCGIVAALVLLVALSNQLSKGEYPGPDHPVHLGILRGWYQFDAGWYEVIATRGYYLVTGQSPVAFFPAYPLAVRALRPLFGGNVPLTAMAVTFACGAGAVALFTVWVRDRLAPRRGPLGRRPAAPLPLQLVPRRRGLRRRLLPPVHPGGVRGARAGPPGARRPPRRRSPPRPARSARPWSLAWRYWRSSGAGPCGPCGEVAPEGAGRLRRLAHHLRLPCGVEWRRLRAADAGVLLSAVGFLAYSGWLWWRYGDPFAFSTVQRYWDQPTGPVTWVKAHLWGNILLHFPSKSRYLLGCLLQGALTVGALLCVPRIARRLGWGYALRRADRHGPAGVGEQGLPGHRPVPAGRLPDLRGGRRVAVRPLSGGAGRGAGGPARALLLLWTHLYARGFYVA